MADVKHGRILRPVTKGARQVTSVMSSFDARSSANLIPTDIWDATRKYKVVSPLQAGIRPSQGLVMETPEARILAEQVPVIYTGRGAMPLTMNDQPTTERKPIRRWPRDWHGENM